MGKQVLKGKWKFRHIEVVPGGASYGFGNYNTLGRTYFVNNITGSSANDGTTWDRAMDEVSTAITASETYREDRGAVTTNDYIRNTIVIQGTGTAYTELTALPSYCDMIGLGADPRGNGTGIARIGPDADLSGATDGVNAAACRGTNFYNLQFQAGSSKAAFDCDKLYRARFENCAFMANNDSVAPSALFISGTTGTWGYGASGVVIQDCHFTGHSETALPSIAIHIAGTHWHNCVVDNCFIAGTVPIQVDSACSAGWGSVFSNNWIGFSYGVGGLAIDDNSSPGFIIYRGNHLAANGTLASNGASRWIENWIANGVAPVTVTAT